MVEKYSEKFNLSKADTVAEILRAYPKPIAYKQKVMEEESRSFKQLIGKLVRFIKQLEDTLSSHKLKFLGFCRQFLPQQSESLYKQYFPEDKIQANLKNWGEVERKHPGIFSRTPHFWVSKGE